jgi:TetR/AcrR family transcriptional regulator, regulator of autoinduction and epiphytic fitness
VKSTDTVKGQRRAYRSAHRRAGAERTREAILGAAVASFEESGWSATTMRAVSVSAGVSLQSVEAIFRTKSALLRASVDFAISGDTEPIPIIQRDAVARMEAAATAEEMLDLHAAHLRAINSRSARLAWAVEQASTNDESVARLWHQMNENRSFGVRWAATTLLAKPDHRRGLGRRDAEAAFWVALDWGTYRTLTGHARLSPEEFEEWLRWYYRSTLLAHRRLTP